MEYLNDSLNANDNNVSTNLYDLLGESNLADNFGNLCSDLDQQYQSNSTGTFSNETEVMYSGSNNDVSWLHSTVYFIIQVFKKCIFCSKTSF